MDIIKGLNSKTTLEHLIFLSNKSIVSVSQELQMTPQQFMDLIKNRRPIPAERLLQMEKYFDIPANILVDENRCAKRLSMLNGIELEIMVLTAQLRFCESADAKEELENRIKRLKTERSKQVRIVRLAALLDVNNPDAMGRIDSLLSDLEKNKSK